MELLVAYKDDPAGYNMAGSLIKDMSSQHDSLYRGDYFDLAIIPTPAISADWLEEKFPNYDSYVFLSKHYAESGMLALTCHSTGNFAEAKYGGKDSQVAIPHSLLQKKYLQNLWKHKDEFSDFEITIEATHHGPTALNKPSLFIEIGTTEREWNDASLCGRVADIVKDTMVAKDDENSPVAICFGGTHYPRKFTKHLLEGRYCLGTVMPKYALEYLDEDLFSHILQRNPKAEVALLDWGGMGKNKENVVKLVEKSDLELVKL